MSLEKIEIEKRKDAIKQKIVKVFEKNMTIFDWDIPEVNERTSANLIFETMQEAMDNLKQKISAGDYDSF